MKRITCWGRLQKDMITHSVFYTDVHVRNSSIINGRINILTCIFSKILIVIISISRFKNEMIKISRHKSLK